ncbi:NIPSNAP family protein [Terriglobus roseus]|uniref:NIPSNAP protein n=1 Tax=Terriglobus roseus TaxID=392734 RepID=A0A1H4KV56_9BACT|nr:NIPSNAP family protein [Terriglobus roseus]SEB62414.1 NIPSNAP protein [Terriglobus roseus]
MNRRDWLKGTATLAAAAGISTKLAEAQAPAAKGGRSYFLLRRYKLQSGPTFGAAANKYFSEALIPALTRMGLGPVGVFNLSYGDGTPTMFVLIPGSDLTALAMLDLNLVKDPAFVAAAAPFWAAPAIAPPFLTVTSTVSIGFEGFPQLVVPAKDPHIVQIRTYVSPTYAAHERKMEMFHQGEFRIFAEAGAKSVFYGDNLIGPDLPSLTYMLAHKDLAAMDQNWKNFTTHPDWKKLSTNPRYASEPTVSRVDNLVLTPTAYSQV